MKRSWNWAFFKFLVFIAILPTVLQFAWAYLKHMDVMTSLLLLGAGLLLLAIKQGQIWSLLRAVLGLLLAPLAWLLNGFNSNGSRFMPFWKRWLFLNPQNQGLVVDGRNRLTRKISYTNLVAVGLVGAGKTSRIIIPNILLQNDSSFVITDLSGEIFLETSGDLKRRGYEIQVVDLVSFKRGLGFNPLHGIQTHTEVAQAAHVLIKSSGLDRGGDPFWSASAEKLLRTIIQCLVNLNDEAYLNLANVKFLLNSFGNQEAFNQFVVRTTLNDTETYHDYMGLISGNAKTVSSILTTAQMALVGLSKDLGKVTAAHQIDFKQLRKRKTALFVMVRQQDISQYAFFLNLFFTRLCHALLSDLYESKKGLPIDLMLDEFGQLMIPDFEVFSATSRKYRVSFALIMQSLKQLDVRYGADNAKVITDSIGSELYFPGMGVDVAHELSRRLGKRQRNGKSMESLMREDQIIHMKDDEALLLHGNKDPIKLKMKPYYKQWKLNRRSKIKPRIRPTNSFPEVSYVPLEASHGFEAPSDLNPPFYDDAPDSPSAGDSADYPESDHD